MVDGRRSVRTAVLAGVMGVVGAFVIIPSAASLVEAQTGSELLSRGLSEFSQSMAETNQCKEKYKGDWNGYYNCSQDAQKRANQRSMQWQMELKEQGAAEEQRLKEETARERCEDREDDRAWALCMKRYMGGR